MISTPNTIGLRESRRIRGDYCLTVNDVKSRRTFADTIGYGSFFIDIHNTKGPGMDVKEWRPPPGFRYQIPYRILLPAGIENLLVAGRCASCDHQALGSLRQMMQCGVMGQAAGTAAALSIGQGCTPRQLPVADLQAALRHAGAILDEADLSAPSS